MNLGLPVSTMLAFLLVLARVSGVVTFLPVPAFRAAPPMVRAVLAVAITVALLPAWPSLPNEVPSIGQLTAWAFLEAGFGLGAGLSLAFLAEGFQLAAQVIGLQAGYGYASTIDPNSDADSGVLQVLMGLGSGLLFFSLGLDRELIRVLAASLERFPAGTWHNAHMGSEAMIRLSSGMFTTGLRVALPVVAVLILIDIALALLGRMQQQLQLLSMAFPIKMLATLLLLAALAPVVPRILEIESSRMLTGWWRALGHN